MCPTAPRVVCRAASLSVALLFGLGCSRDGGGTGGDGKSGAAGPKFGKPDFSLTAKGLAQEYKKNRQATEAKYKDRVVEVSGLVITITDLGENGAAVTLEGDPDASLSFVTCYTADPKPWNRVTPDQIVKLKGRWRDINFSAALRDCEIEEVTGPRAPALTAHEFASEVARDPGGADRQYANKWVILTGELGKVEGARVTFKTGVKAPHVVCALPDDRGQSFKGFNPGRRIRVLGSCLFANEEKAFVTDCILLDAGK